MSTCPYPPPAHVEPKPLRSDAVPTLSCREGCQRTLFFCPYCRQANRPLARYCRDCGKPVSFEDSEGPSERQFSIDNFSEQKYTYSLISYGIGEVRVLRSYRGYLFVLGETGLLIFDVHSLAEPLAGPLRSPLGGEFLGVSVYADADNEVLLVTTSTGVFRMSLLALELSAERPTLEPVYASQVSHFVSHEAVAIAGRICIIEHDTARSESWLTCVPDGVVSTFNQTSRPPIAVAGDRLFFFTESKAFLYECKTGKLIEAESSDPLANRSATYDAEANMIFMAGEAKLWRMELNREAPTLAPLSTPKPLRGASLAARANRLFVAYLGGITILDMFGSKKWDSADLYPAQSDGLPPQVCGNLFTFTLPGRRFGRIVRIHQLDDPDKSKDIQFDASLLSPPLFALGRMFVAAGDQLSVNDFRLSGERVGAGGL